MGVGSFIPEIWASQFLESLKKAQVYASLCNRDYEGEIAQAGDTVHITSVSRPTIATYVPNVTVITPEVLTTADRALLIDQVKYFAFEVDDVDKRQAAGNLVDAAMTEAAFGVSDVTDQFVAGLYTNTQAANVIGTIAVTTGDIAYTQLTKLSQKLNEANVPSLGRWVVLAPWYLQLLLDTNKVAFNPNPGASAETGSAVREGFVNRLLGFDVYVSNNAPLITGDDYAIIAGTKAAATYADQINKTEAYRPQSAFADAVKGLHLYGAKLVRPDGWAYITASQT